MRVFKRILLFLLIFAVIAEVGALIKCAVLTDKYSSDFSDNWRENTMLSDIDYFKILDCNGESAKVYCIEKDRSLAHILYFENENGQYVFALANGGGRDGFCESDWTLEPGAAIACCNDGCRPAIFKLEATDIPSVMGE